VAEAGAALARHHVCGTQDLRTGQSTQIQKSHTKHTQSTPTQSTHTRHTHKAHRAHTEHIYMCIYGYGSVHTHEAHPHKEYIYLCIYRNMCVVSCSGTDIVGNVYRPIYILVPINCSPLTSPQPSPLSLPISLKNHTTKPCPLFLLPRATRRGTHYTQTRPNKVPAP
jgi:hypothetical protein